MLFLKSNNGQSCFSVLGLSVWNGVPEKLDFLAWKEANRKKVELLSVLTFIEETMKTLATCGKQLKNHLDINLIQMEI